MLPQALGTKNELLLISLNLASSGNKALEKYFAWTTLLTLVLMNTWYILYDFLVHLGEYWSYEKQQTNTMS